MGSADLGIPSLYSFSLPSLLKLALVKPTVKESLVFLAKLEAMAIIAVMSPGYSVLEPIVSVLIFLSIFLLSSCFLFSFYQN